jgi:hypothetical protein
MPITGQHFVGGERSAAGEQSFVAQNPTTGADLAPRFTEATIEEVDRCLTLADQAFNAL